LRSHLKGPDDQSGTTAETTREGKKLCRVEEKTNGKRCKASVKCHKAGSTWIVKKVKNREHLGGGPRENHLNSKQGCNPPHKKKKNKTQKKKIPNKK